MNLDEKQINVTFLSLKEDMWGSITVERITDLDKITQIENEAKRTVLPLYSYPCSFLKCRQDIFVPLFFECFASHSLPNVHETDTWGQINTLQKLNDRKKTFLWFLILCRLLKFTCNKALQGKKNNQKKTRGRGELIRKSHREARNSSERPIHLLFTKLPSGAVMDLQQQFTWAELSLAWLFCSWSVYATFPKPEGLFYVRVHMISALAAFLSFLFFFFLIALKICDCQELCISLCPRSLLLL